MTVPLKFDDCKGCCFYSRSRINPACKHCDSGEFYEERASGREKSRHELMDLYKELTEDDDE
jgi:hypothetical protein